MNSGDLEWLQTGTNVDEDLGRMEVLEAKLWENWQRRWDLSEKGRLIYDFVPNVRFARENEWFQP